MTELYHQSIPFSTKICPLCNLEKSCSQYTLRKDGRYVARCNDCIRSLDRKRNKLRRPRKTPIVLKSTEENCKFCNTCFIEKPYASFSHDSAQMDGYRGRCKQCYKDQWEDLSEEEKIEKRRRDRESRKPRKEQINARDRKRHNTDENRARRRDRVAIRKMEDPEYREAITRANAEWRRDNPLAVRELNQRHKPGQRAARSVGRVRYKHILERDGHFCYICNRDILPDQDMAFDHEIPLHPRRGEPQGIHAEYNIHPTHSVCNLRKANKRLESLTDWDRRGP